jgi:peptidoglycan/LPS O-acetylase OafA/YrhL
MSEHKNLPGLDGLRAIALAMVLLFHRGALLMGWIGVQAFFVLSGYLITGLLVNAKNQPAARYFRNFYGRRAVRISPLYYAVIALFAIAGQRGWLRSGGLESLPYAATYTYNIWFSTHATRFSMLLTHFWSLCVEEQFYLISPFLIYVTPRARLKALLGALIAVGPVLRLVRAWYILRAGAGHLRIRSSVCTGLRPRSSMPSRPAVCWRYFPWADPPTLCY